MQGLISSIYIIVVVLAVVAWAHDPRQSGFRVITYSLLWPISVIMRFVILLWIGFQYLIGARGTLYIWDHREKQ